MNLHIDYIAVFGGEDGISADEESELLWKEIAKNSDTEIKIIKEGRESVFWGPTGDEGPCGPTTDIYVNGVEIWSIVFNEYYQHKDKRLENLKLAGIDTGIGLERLATVVQKKKNIYETDLLEPILKLVPSELELKTKRIIADHSRAIAFLLSDGVRPSNKEQGYVLRRLMRRIITYNFLAKSDIALMHNIFVKIIEIYGQCYPNLNVSTIIYEFTHEKEKFEKTLKHGLKELKRLEKLDAQLAFKLYESYGLPYEIIKELAKDKAKYLSREKFDEEFKKHQDKSRVGAMKKFGGHGLLLDTGELKAGNEEELKKATRLHTATHLLHASLRKVLGDEIKQAGSDITAERLRFDFTFPRKLTSEERQKVEDLANEAVKKDYKVIKEEMLYEDALKSGALAFFKLKYPLRVNVYSVGPSTGSTDSLQAGLELAFSRELCGGPHVSHTTEIGHIKITKEESVSAGVRRIRAIVLD